jgi:hypothetical protein
MGVAMVKRLTGLQYITPFREGGSVPAVVGTDEPGEYVVKFRGAGQGAKALIAELLAAELADALGLPIPAHALVELDAGFGQSEPDPEIQDILRGSVGTNFGLAYLRSTLAFDPAADRGIVAPDLATAIVWFDAFITNVDRTARNTNMLMQRGKLFLIDHGASLYFHHLPQDWAKSALSRFPHIKDHVLLAAAGDIGAAGAQLAPLLTETVLRGIVAAVPDEWLAGEERFADTAAHREAYARYFLARLEEPRLFEQEASDAAAVLRVV